MKNKKIISLIILTFLSFILFSYSNGRMKEELKRDHIVGVKIYEYQKLLPKLFEEWRSLGINTAFVSVSLYSKKEFRELAKRNDISTFIIVPIFYNP